MKSTFLILCACLCLTSAAQAGTVWSNGDVLAGGNSCDTQVNNVCASTSWTVADNFQVLGPTTISAFTYNDVPISGTYTGTLWGIWNGDPFAGGFVVASGAATGTATAAAAGTEQVTVDGLSVHLDAGTYWLAIQTQLNDLVWARANAGGGGLTGYEQWDGGPSSGGSAFRFNLAGDTAFTLQGTNAPEPKGELLMGLGLIGLSLLFRLLAGRRNSVDRVSRF
jgi:hypothetical protein